MTKVQPKPGHCWKKYGKAPKPLTPVAPELRSYSPVKVYTVEEKAELEKLYSKGKR